MRLQRVRQTMAGFHKGLLRFVPRNQTNRTPGRANRNTHLVCRGPGRSGRKLVGISARSPNFPRGRNVQADKYCIAVGIRDCSAIFIGRVGIVVARHHHAITLTLEFTSHHPRKNQDDVLFHLAVWPARAVIRSAVRRIDDDHRTRMRAGRPESQDSVRERLAAGPGAGACGGGETCAGV